jgi:hypothetical protein
VAEQEFTQLNLNLQYYHVITRELAIFTHNFGNVVRSGILQAKNEPASEVAKLVFTPRPRGF